MRINQAKIKDKLCQICNLSLKVETGLYFKYYHPECIKKHNRREKMVDYITTDFNKDQVQEEYDRKLEKEYSEDDE